MAVNEMRWVRVRATGSAARSTRDFALRPARGFAAREAALVELELPDLSEYATPLSKARFLLDTAAEIEQALMLQYLYAAYSLRDSTDPDLTADQRSAVFKWRALVVDTAVDEMGHLMTIQNLLHILRQPPNFEREDFPPRKNLYPFAMNLEPLTQRSLAKYVVAESPSDAQGIEDILTLAFGASGMAVNRVGILYAILGVVFTRREDLATNANGGDPWSVCVRDIGMMLFETFADQPPEEWHLQDAHFDAASVSRQADSSWEGGGSMRVIAVANRNECLEALKFISLQGEGISTIDSVSAPSHFERFLSIYRGGDGSVAFPAEGDWLPTKSVATNPFIDLLSTDTNAISDATATQWATLANLRYSLLLALLQQYYLDDPSRRDPIRDWCIAGAMTPLRSLNRKLVTLNRRSDAMVKASIPFSLPSVINLPSDQESRIALIKRRMARSRHITQTLRAGGASEAVLDQIESADQSLLSALGIKLTPLPTDPSEPPPTTSPQETAMLQLIETKQPRAISPHPGVPAHGTTLRQLFRDNRFADILSFLKQGVAIVDPHTGKKLIEPGKPEQSAFFLHISQDDGAMSGQFTDEEISIVREWIVSLAPTAPTPSTDPVTPTAPPVKEPNPKRQMIELLKSKKIRAQVMHGAISAPGGESLSDLFRGERYEEILAFLKNSASVVDPFTGKPLITAGVPRESAFFLHISDARGAMAGRFSPDEIAIVERWIMSLAQDKGSGSSPSSPFRCQSRLVASGLNSPVCIATPPNDASRLFIVEQSGSIKIVRPSDGVIAPTPFLHISDISSGGERGLLGLVFHPDYANNRTFFVNCTNVQGATEIRSYQTKTSTPDEAEPSSRKTLLTIPQPFRNHNGGWIAFGPRDGYLYIGMGDGGSGNDPQNNAQNLNSLLGKMLRIDVNADDFPADSTRNYAIPPSNPFVNRNDARPEIWAYGLRNPWRCAFDRQTGDLYIGDVGQNKREEIDFQPGSSTGGENYGWRLREGTLDTGLGGATAASLIDPIHEYGPPDGFAVIGGSVYRGQQFPAMRGVYYFGDHGGRIWSLVQGTSRQIEERTAELTIDRDHPLANLSTFGEDANGEIFFATLEGDLFQLTAESSVIAEDRWKETAKIRIHPAIGIARVGNAGFTGGVPSTPAPREDFFIGPERPFETIPPMGGYKRNGRIRRQAARFRLYAYDASDHLIGEITSDVADITWTVELANKKASFRQFTGLSISTQLRNSSVVGANRANLEITPGAKTLNGPNQSAAFDGGSFTDWEAGTPRTVSNIYLGELQTEESGRLLVLGGEGIGKTPWNRSITNFVNNDGWFDTISDGPVQASVKFKSTNATLEAVKSWVICAPPKFAPALRNVVTLRDVLFDIAVQKGWLAIPDKPSFRHDIYPILYRAISLQWLLAAAGSNHDPIADSFPPTPTVDPAEVFRRLRSPQAGTNGPGMNMPQLFDDENGWVRSGNRGLTFTGSMYEMLRRWSVGQYMDDWSGEPPLPPAEITPRGLDEASLENCSGGGFFPGIEVGWMMRDTLQYIEPFRLDTSALKAGDISRQMAVPWQADFYKCTTTSFDGRRVGWWPQQRPDDVFIEGSNARQAWIRDKIGSHKDMVDKWHELGFVVNNGTRFVETERNPDSGFV